MLKDVYQNVKPAVVAIALTKCIDNAFPTIIGTGFFIREDGIILTNRHVLDAINDLEEVTAGASPFEQATVLMFIQSEKMMRILPLEIDKFWLVEQTLPAETVYYGKAPDIAVIVLKNVRSCPTVRIYSGEYCEGEAVAVSGFPMGTETLKAPGYIHQLTPTLKTGVIGGILPFKCKTPHALLLDMMVQGGSSGSPVFLQSTGEIMGIVYGGMTENQNMTNLTYCIPSWYFEELLKKMEEKDELNKLRERKIPLKEWIASRDVRQRGPGIPFFQ
jgi:S1-C subfamily serine protease